MKVHPVAEFFPMMTDGELADLAADIKANGQLHPIIVDNDDAVIDGRNRLRACEIAGVEPQFEKANGADLLRLVISLNAKRRDLTASKRAVAAAEAWAYAEEAGRVLTGKGGDRSKAQSGHCIKDPRNFFADQFGVGKNYVEQARALKRGDPLAFAAVKDGAPLAASYDALTMRLGTAENTKARLKRLAEKRPDLAELVAAEQATLEAAEQRAEREESERKKQRWAFTMNMLDAVLALERPPESAVELAGHYDAAHAATRGETLTSDRLRAAARFALAFADAIEKGAEQ
jgi:ParB-like chromosome segregation protein Spo0J